VRRLSVVDQKKPLFQRQETGVILVALCAPAKPSMQTMKRSFLVALLGAFLTLPFQSLLARMPTQVDNDGARSYWQFLFLLEKTSSPGQREFIFHPFYSSYSNDEKAYSYSTILYPIFYSHGTNYWRKWTLLYFITGDDFYHEDTQEDTDLFLSPLFNWGRGDNEREHYFSLFPIAGSIHNKLSWSEIHYILFPIYSGWSYKDYSAHAILWPLIMWGSSPTRSDLRILPFYSSKIHEGKYERRAALWPFIQWGHEDLDKKDPRGYFFFFPLFGRKWSESGEQKAYTALWPLFSWGWDDNPKRNAFDLNILWFLFQYGYNDDPVVRKRIFFPFYGYYRFEHFEGTFITPLFTQLKTHSIVAETNYNILIFAPTVWVSDRYYRQERESESYFKIWPLFQYVTDSRGNSGFRTLTLWPFRSDEFERLWGPLYSLFEYQKFENGDRYFATMFRIYSQYWNEKEFHLFFLGFEYHRTELYWSFEFLGGLLGMRRDTPQAGEPYSTMKILWQDI